MKALGILLFIAGFGLCFTGALLIGLIVLSIGAICFSVGGDKINKEESNKWILERTSYYIGKGLQPSDSKVKAETEAPNRYKYMYYCKNCNSIYNHDGDSAKCKCPKCKERLFATKCSYIDWHNLDEKGKSAEKETWSK